MNKIFENTKSIWVKYTDYELKEDKTGIAYLTPAKDAAPIMYKPFDVAENIVLDAVNIGKMLISKEAEKEIDKAIMAFVKNYGLLGIMTAIPTTPSFMDYEAVYLTKNPFIDNESMTTFGYLGYFFPFEKPDLSKNGKECRWDIGGDVGAMALALTLGDEPMAFALSLQKLYAERYDWIKTMFRDWAFTFITSTLYYNDKHSLTDEQKMLYQKSIMIYDGIAPTYHIALKEDKPVLVWDFYSLSNVIRLLFSSALTDEKNPLRLCRHCQNAFIASRPNALFCSTQCKNRFNVYKTRKKGKK
ncbi:MAG: hypothetical protein Q4C12_05915 [Clostridia bacterium]|nr:hypothetical protein [Clostridia bacterium]